MRPSSIASEETATVILSREAPAELAGLLDAVDVVEDIIVLGYVERDARPPRFQMSPTIVALQTADAFLNLVWNHANRLTVHASQTAVIPGELAEEPSIEPMYAVVTRNHLGENERIIRLTGARFFRDFGPEDEFCGALFEFEYDNALFVDPLTSLGMITGSKHDWSAWRDERAASDQDVIELHWTRR